MRRFWITVLLGALPIAALADEAEERLLSAELLEVSAGDFEKALASFKAISGDDKAPEGVRAKALLGLARCQRKLGQLEAAKKTLDDLVKAPAKDPEILRQARSYLRELAGGRAENPDFDWVREIEKNPEIQARVFEWAMQLVGVSNDEDPVAGRQLLALGTIALPVVERVLDASRDPVHRHHLALIAIRSGRIERLQVLLDPAEPVHIGPRRIRWGVEQVLEKLSAASADERKRVLDVLAGVPRSPRTDAVRAALEIAAGDTRDLVTKLQVLDQGQLFAKVMSSDLLGREPAAADAFLARLVDRSSHVMTRRTYFDALLELAPLKLTEEHWAIVEELATENRGRILGYIQRLESLGKFDILGRLAAGNSGEQMNEWFEARYLKTNKLREAPGKWAAVLRHPAQRQGRPTMHLSWLHRLAEANDEAAVEFAAYLRARSVGDPGLNPTRPNHDPNWTPSPKYAELMAGLLDSKDPVVLTIALEALAITTPGADVDILPALERLLLGESGNESVCTAAVKALLRHLESQPGTGAAVAAIFRKHCRQRLETCTANAVRATPAPVLLDLFRELFALDLDEGDSGWIPVLFEQLPQPEAWNLLLENLPKLDTPGKRSALLGGLEAGELAKSTAGLEFLRGVAMDASLSPRVRLNAVRSTGEAGMAWLDWAELARKDDPIVEEVSDHSLGLWLAQRPRAEQDAFLDALARSKSPVLRESRLDIYPRDRPDYPDVLLKALEDPSEVVQRTAVGYLLKVEKLQGPALYARLLEHPEARRMKDVYVNVTASGDPQLLEPLVKLLDDRDSKVRTFALGTLKTIRQELEEKKEWQAILQAARERKNE